MRVMDTGFEDYRGDRLRDAVNDPEQLRSWIARMEPFLAGGDPDEVVGIMVKDLALLVDLLKEYEYEDGWR